MRTKALQVYKFGGVSVGNAEAIRLAHARVAEAAPSVVVVVSAMSGVTDLLLGAARASRAGDSVAADRAIAEFARRHYELIGLLVPRRSAAAALEGVLEASTAELRAVCDSVAVLHELTPRTLDLVASRGERVLARIFATFLSEKGLDAELVDAAELLFLERRGDGLWPDLPRCERAARARLGPLLRRGRAVVVPGFLGTGPEGELVTLGRGGSDLSASLLAHSLGAKSVTLFKDVDGLMTADPKSVPEARVLAELNYREAAELAYYGAKVLHPRTMIPLLERRIPLLIRNTFSPESPGTRIGADVGPGSYPVKALSAVRSQALVSVEGNGMMGVPGIAARTFGALSAAGHSVTMISQASSESSICFVVPQSEADDARRALERAFAPELEHHFIDAIAVERPVALVAVVGLGMAGTPGIASRTTAPLAREGINIRAIAQGSSELNITLALAEADCDRALRALHEEFQLEKLHTVADTQGRQASVVLFGVGQIGRALARQLNRQGRYFRQDLGVEIRCVAAVDRTGVRVEPKGFETSELEAVCARKEAGQPLFPRRTRLEPAALGLELGRTLWPLALPRPVFVDMTALDDAPLIRAALEQGFHVVLANKKPLAGPQADFDALFEAARRRGLALRYEATVGAGLPVLDTLKKLEDAGDPVASVLGCLSGTLGYLVTQLDENVPFSQAVRAAHALGYTEPDPKDDLAGTDVARKALILARTIGRRLEPKDVAVEPLFPAHLAKLSPEEFLERLPELDAEYAERVAKARAARSVLRYVARIDARGIRVGLETVPESSATGRLKGPDNQIVIHTRRYKTNPLVVTGPGAGAEVTAAGVLNDIVAIARGRERR